jgi:NADH-quinone oxidoreductase subunit J
MLAGLFGVLGLWLMLPRGLALGRSIGIVLLATALGLGISQWPPVGEYCEACLFNVLAVVTIFSAVGAVTFRNPIYCAIWFGQMLLGTAGLFLFTGAQFLAVATVVVYAGAILVTFLFVLMLAQPEGKAAYDRRSWEAFLSAATGVVMIGILSMTIGGVLASGGPSKALPQPPSDADLTNNVLASNHVAQLGSELFGHHLLAVEVAGTLLLAALVGAAVIVGNNNSNDNSGRDNACKDRFAKDKKSS